MVLPCDLPVPRSPVRAVGELAAASLSLATLSACSDKSTESGPSGAEGGAAQIEGVVRTFLLAFNNHDGKTLIDQLDNTACTQVFGEPCKTLRGHPDDLFAGQPAVDLRSLGTPTINGDKASLSAVTRIQNGLHASNFQLDHSLGSWVIKNFQVDSNAGGPVPEGVPTVDVTLRDYAFELDESALVSGQFALSAHNAGKEAHEVVIKRVDVEADLKLALTPGAKQPPANTHFIPFAASATIEPGQTSTLVMAEMLDAIIDRMGQAQTRSRTLMRHIHSWDSR